MTDPVIDPNPHDYRIPPVRPALLLTLSTLLALVLSSGCANRTESPTPNILTGIPSTNVFACDDHDLALPFWVSRGKTDRIVVHIDAHDDFRFIDPELLAPLKEAVASKNPTAVADLADDTSVNGCYNVGNFVYAAASVGVIRELVWVVPAGEGSTGPDGWKQWLTDRGYPTSDIATFKGEPDHVTGTLYGIKTTITTLDRFVAPSEPVLLDIDTDFIPAYDQAHSINNPLYGARQLILALQAKRLSVDVATVASSVRGDYLPLTHRWLIDVLSESLVLPEIAQREAPPERWALMGQAIEEESSDPGRAEELWRAAVKVSPDDPAPAYGLGRILIATGRTEEGVAAVTEAVRLNPVYAEGWLQLAAEATSQRDARAVGLVDRAKSLVSDYSYLMRRGDVLYYLGRYKDAAESYRALCSRYDHPDGWMQLGTALLASDDNVGARAAYTKGTALLDTITFRDVADYPDALPELAAMAEERGDLTTAIDYYQLYAQILPTGPAIERVNTRLDELGL